MHIAIEIVAAVVVIKIEGREEVVVVVSRSSRSGRSRSGRSRSGSDFIIIRCLKQLCTPASVREKSMP